MRTPQHHAGSQGDAGARQQGTEPPKKRTKHDTGRQRSIGMGNHVQQAGAIAVQEGAAPHVAELQAAYEAARATAHAAADAAAHAASCQEAAAAETAVQDHAYKAARKALRAAVDALARAVARKAVARAARKAARRAARKAAKAALAAEAEQQDAVTRKQQAKAAYRAAEAAQAAQDGEALEGGNTHTAAGTGAAGECAGKAKWYQCPRCALPACMGQPCSTCLSCAVQVTRFKQLSQLK